jgi:hypothetical protein
VVFLLSVILLLGGVNTERAIVEGIMLLCAMPDRGHIIASQGQFGRCAMRMPSLCCHTFSAEVTHLTNVTYMEVYISLDWHKLLTALSPDGMH